ncbi:hypothetical protein ACX31A_07230 [Dermacoccus nishinomiyaensis]
MTSATTTDPPIVNHVSLIVETVLEIGLSEAVRHPATSREKRVLGRDLVEHVHDDLADGDEHPERHESRQDSALQDGDEHLLGRRAG